MASAASSRAVTFRADDGFELRGRLFGDPAAAHHALLVVPAMGVPQRFYAEFAEWLAGQGACVLTFDYRGMGDSRPAHLRGSLRGLDADVLTWAERDTAAALDFLDGKVGAAMPIHWLGHSLGGQIFGLVPNRGRVSRMVTVACGSGYWRENAASARRLVWWLWWVMVPLALPVFGYFPGRRLRKIGDLPLNVMAQWRRWCLHRDYLLGEGGEARRERYARVTTPILSLSFTDDEFMSLRNTESIHGFYAAAPKRMDRISPGDIGVRRIGHFGFFRKPFESTLWPRVAGWLNTPDLSPMETAR